VFLSVTLEIRLYIYINLLKIHVQLGHHNYWTVFSWTMCFHQWFHKRLAYNKQLILQPLEAFLSCLSGHCNDL